MQLYSATPAVRARQVAADLVALAAIVLFIVLGTAVGAAIGALGEVGRQLTDAGAGFQGTLTDAATTIGDVPLIGDAASAPLESAGAAGGTLAEAGRETERIVGLVALLAGLAIAGLPSLFVLRSRVRRHAVAARRAGAARRLLELPEADELLALRALASAPAARLAAVAERPVDAWRRRDPGALRALADLELAEAGVRRG